MKTIILVLFILFSADMTFCQSTKWATVDYHYSKGPVSPEYQYSYNIIISKDGSGTLIYDKAGKRDEYNFRVGKKNMKKLNKSLRNSQVFEVNQDSLKSNSEMIGGPERNVTVTMWQNPDLDQKPQIITVPNSLKDEYRADFENLFNTIEKLVPDSIYEKINY